MARSLNGTRHCDVPSHLDDSTKNGSRLKDFSAKVEKSQLLGKQFSFVALAATKLTLANLWITTHDREPAKTAGPVGRSPLASLFVESHRFGARHRSGPISMSFSRKEDA